MLLQHASISFWLTSLQRGEQIRQRWDCRENSRSDCCSVMPDDHISRKCSRVYQLPCSLLCSPTCQLLLNGALREGGRANYIFCHAHDGIISECSGVCWLPFGSPLQASVVRTGICFWREGCTKSTPLSYCTINNSYIRCI